jgi:hypothetical protein
MVKPSQSQQSSKAVQELVASVRSNVDVIRDALKGPATEDSHAVVSDLMLEVKQSQEKLQKKAAELADSGEFDNTNEIFEAIDQVTQLEPEYDSWSRNVSGRVPDAPDADQIGSSIHVEENGDVTKVKKKKKKKRKESLPAEASGGWEAFPPPPGETTASAWPSQSAPQEPAPTMPAPQSVRFEEPVIATDPVTQTNPSAPARGRITLGMTWDMLGPLLGDPGSSDDERKKRLAELMKEAIATECGISQTRINITRIS